MKTAYFINTASHRGARCALCGADQRYVAGAGLDVHYEEPRPLNDRFAKLRNVIMTPHLAGGSRKGVVDEIELALNNCRAVLTGNPIKYRAV